MAQGARTGLRTMSILPLLAAFLLSFAVMLASVPAKADSRYAALVMNADTGDVIYSRNADLRRYPASLTKLMTLYLLFEAIDEGRLEMDDPLYVSSRAAGQPPSKLGVEQGSTISVEDAIQALVVRSANDVAVVVAEGLADSEWEFGRLMTRRAREMGMDQTRFENASGLPHRRQQTTARNLAILAMSVVQDFPQHLHYFSQESFTYEGRTWRTHNNLLDDYEGTTGLKTGYTRASGFNLIATVERDGFSLVGIVLGGRTAARRDREMERILDLNFSRLHDDPHFGSRVFASDIRPQRRPNPNARTPGVDTLVASLAPSVGPEQRPNDVLSPALAAIPSPELNPAQVAVPGEELVSPQLAPEAVPETVPQINQLAALADAEPLLDPVLDAAIENEQKPAQEDLGIQLVLNEIPVAVGDTDPTSGLGAFLEPAGDPTGWGIQVGRFLLPEQADRRLQHVAASVPTVLTWGMAAIVPDRDAVTMEFDASFGPMSEDEAVDVCASLARLSFDCQPTDTVDWDLAIRR